MDGPAQVFTRYHEKEITYLRSYVYREESELTKLIKSYDANSLYPYCSDDLRHVVNEKSFDQKRMAKSSKDV